MQDFSIAWLLSERDAEYAQRIAGCECGDPEGGHSMADALLLEIIRDAGYTAAADAFEKLTKWYS